MNEFESNEEMYFSWWLDELKKHGYITLLKYQPKSFKLFDGATIGFIEQLKTKTKERTVKLLVGHEYKADFLIYWSKELHKKLYVGYNDILTQSVKSYPIIANYSSERDLYYSVIDVKGNYNQNDAWRRFAIDQKWVFQIHHIYVQKIITHPQVNKKGQIIPANALFPTTFLPERFKTTDKSGGPRKIRYKYKSLDEYLLTRAGIDN